MGLVGIEWAAGLFEGEGCISLEQNRFPRLTLSMTDRDVVERFAEVVGVGAVLEHNPPSLAEYQVQWRWRVNNRQAVTAVLISLLPYLGERRTQKAKEALDAFERYNRPKSRRT